MLMRGEKWKKVGKSGGVCGKDFHQTNYLYEFTLKVLSYKFLI